MQLLVNFNHIRLLKVLPAVSTHVQNANEPANDCNSFNVTFFLFNANNNFSINSNMLSMGMFINIFPVSIVRPRYSIIVMGLSVFSCARVQWVLPSVHKHLQIPPSDSDIGSYLIPNQKRNHPNNDPHSLG